MALIPSFLGNRSIFDPFSFDARETSLPLYRTSPEVASFVNTQIDWKETPEAHIFKADLPGLKKEEVKVEIEEGNVLKISGEKKVEKEEKDDKWHRVERSRGKFLRQFRLPDNARLDAVSASMQYGVLTVTVPKEEVKKPEVKSIEISGRVQNQVLASSSILATPIKMEVFLGNFVKAFTSSLMLRATREGACEIQVITQTHLCFTENTCTIKPPLNDGLK